MSAKTLYEQIGGENAIRDLVNRFYEHVLDDEELSRFFVDVPADRLRQMQREFFSMALDGPATYTGRPLDKVHAGRGIDPRHFERFIHHLLHTLREIGVPERSLDPVIERVRTLEAHIVANSTAEPGDAG